MDRIVGIDYGRKRVGVAVSDPLGIFASALDTVQSAKIIDYLKKYAENENVVRFVVGYPINMDGRPSEAAKDIDIFLKHLAKAFPEIPVGSRSFVRGGCSPCLLPHPPIHSGLCGEGSYWHRHLCHRFVAGGTHLHGYPLVADTHGSKH